MKKIHVDMRKLGIVLALLVLVCACGCADDAVPWQKDRVTITAENIDKYILVDDNTLEQTYVGPLIWEDETALAFADTLMIGLDASFDTEDIVSKVTAYDMYKEMYLIKKETADGRSYAVELWVHQAGKIMIKNVYMDDQLISTPYIQNEEQAKRLADVIMSSVYEVDVRLPIEETYPDIEASPRGSTGWWISRCEADTFGGAVHICVDAEGVLYDLTWGGE